jgi:hypothetical protein
MTKKRTSKVPNFGAAPKQVGAKKSLPQAQPAKPAPARQSVQPRATSAKSGHRGK